MPRPSSAGFYLLDQKHSHLEALYGADTRKFGCTKHLAERIHDDAYTTYAGPGTVSYVFAAETDTEEEARRLEALFKQASHEMADCFPAKGVREFVRMSVVSVKRIVETLAHDNDIRIKVVDKPEYARAVKLGKRSAAERVQPLSAATRQALAHILATESDVEYARDEFVLFLRSEAKGKEKRGLSEVNVRATTKVVDDLMQGKGVKGHGWSATFYEGTALDIARVDLEQLRQDGREFVKRYGSCPHNDAAVGGYNKRRALAHNEKYDASNGWNLNHPLAKLAEYKRWKAGKRAAIVA